MNQHPEATQAGNRPPLAVPAYLGASEGKPPVDCPTPSLAPFSGNPKPASPGGFGKTSPDPDLPGLPVAPVPARAA